MLIGYSDFWPPYIDGTSEGTIVQLQLLILVIGNLVVVFIFSRLLNAQVLKDFKKGTVIGDVLKVSVFLSEEVLEYLIGVIDRLEEIMTEGTEGV